MLSYADKLKSAILNLFAVKKEGLISQESYVENVPKPQTSRVVAVA